MKLLLLGLLSLFAVTSSHWAEAAPVTKAPFEKVVFLSAAVNATQSAANSGVDYKNPKGFFDGDLWSIPAGTVIEDMYLIVDTSVSGLSAFTVGDDDAATGFITASALSAGLNNYALGQKGSYFRSTAGDLAGATVRTAKYYSAAGKEVKLDVTGTASAGRARLVIRGYSIGAL